jgi:hypothetical protein
MCTKANLTMSSSKTYAKSIDFTEKLGIPLNISLAYQFLFSHFSIINTHSTDLSTEVGAGTSSLITALVSGGQKPPPKYGPNFFPGWVLYRAGKDESASVRE